MGTDKLTGQLSYSYFAHIPLCSDIRFVLIGHGPKDITPSIHTTSGKPYLSNRTKVIFSDPNNDTPSSDLGKSVKNMKYLLGKMRSRLNLTTLRRSF